MIHHAGENSPEAPQRSLLIHPELIWGLILHPKIMAQIFLICWMYKTIINNYVWVVLVFKYTGLVCTPTSDVVGMVLSATRLGPKGNVLKAAGSSSTISTSLQSTYRAVRGLPCISPLKCSKTLCGRPSANGMLTKVAVPTFPLLFIYLRETERDRQRCLSASRCLYLSK